MTLSISVVVSSNGNGTTPWLSEPVIVQRVRCTACGCRGARLGSAVGNVDEAAFAARSVSPKPAPSLFAVGELSTPMCPGAWCATRAVVSEGDALGLAVSKSMDTTEDAGGGIIVCSEVGGAGSLDAAAGLRNLHSCRSMPAR
jgi:hypothetical protein